MDRVRRALVVMLSAVPLAPAWAGSRAPKVVELDIASDGDTLAFIPNHLSCVTGAHVRLRLRHAGVISSDPHDWVLLRPGMESAFLADADKQQIDDVVIPPNDGGMVIAATPLCPKGKTVTVEFIAPAPGRYLFVCSMPGHAETMRGILNVRAKPTSKESQE
jgi:azurin